MAWICPTFQRPERLAELAASWEVCETGKELYVRIWADDPKKEEYFSRKWPKTWQFYESSAETCVAAVDEFFHLHPKEKRYGFIGDDVVLRTRRGLERLEQQAERWFIAYPNDLIQRNRLCTHFCVGGELARTIGWLMPPQFKHGYCDIALYNLGINTGTLRYCPDVIFDHQHPHVQKAEQDDTYDRGDAYVEQGLREWKLYSAEQLAKDVMRVLKATHQHNENPITWGYRDGFIRSSVA